jgi:hypothetical protein
MLILKRLYSNLCILRRRTVCSNIKMDLREVAWGSWTGCCECGNEPSGSIKCGEFLEYLRVLASQKGLYSMELVS